MGEFGWPPGAQWRRREAIGKMIVLRNADDIVVGFEHEADAKHFWDAMRERFEQFALELHGDKTRLLEFDRLAAERRQRRGLGKPETFTFLGFVFIYLRQVPTLGLPASAQDQRRPDEDHASRDQGQLRERVHDAYPAQGRWLKAVVTGYFAYHAVPTNSQALGVLRYHVTNRWRRTLRRRSQKDRLTWERMTKIAEDWLPRPRILHPWPAQRFAVKHPRWKPSA